MALNCLSISTIKKDFVTSLDYLSQTPIVRSSDTATFLTLTRITPAQLDPLEAEG